MTIEAAGGVLWRPALGGAGVEVALVHRPKYDDWSLPKGKLRTGEHALLGALREVEEETGYQAQLGRSLGEIHYVKDGAPKRVRYWAMRATAGEFTPNTEVDQLMWLPPREGARHLMEDRDEPILEAFAADPTPTWPFLVVRHGCAGERSAWSGEDRSRPLDEIGHRQAGELVPLLEAFGVERVLSADVLRCLDTVGPFASRHELTVESEPLLSETGYPEHPDQAVSRVVELAKSGVPTAICSQGRVIPALVELLIDHLDGDPPTDTSVRKGGFWVLHMARDGDIRVAAAEAFAALG